MVENKREDLFELIKSLTPTEKAYFIKYAQRNHTGTRNDYLWLFTELNKQEVFDWEAIQKKIPIGMFKSGKQKAFSRLLTLLLKSMRAFQEGTKPVNQINSLIEEAEFLMEKGFLLPFKKKIQAAQKIAVKYRLDQQQMKLFMYEELIHFHGMGDTSFQNLAGRELLMLEKLKLNIICKREINSFLKLLSKDPNSRSKRDEHAIKESVTFFSSIESNKVSYDVYLELLVTQFVYFFYELKDYHQAITLQDACLACFLSNKNNINIYPSKFLAVYQNALVCYLLTREYRKLEALKAMPDELNLNKDWREQINRICMPYLLNYYLRKGHLKKCDEIVQAFDKIDQAKYQGMWKASLGYQYLINGFYYLEKKEYRLCLDTLNQFLRLKQDNSNILVVISFFLSCLSLHALNEESLLESAINKMRYVVYTKTPEQTIAKVVFRLIFAITQTNNKRDIERLRRKYNSLKQQERSKVWLFFDINLILPKPTTNFRSANKQLLLNT